MIMSRVPKKWFHEVRADITVVVDALDWFSAELDAGFKDLEIMGNLEALNRHQPGLMAYYDAMHTDLEMIREYFERRLKKVRAVRLREWIDNPPTNAKLGSNDTKALLDADDEVSDAAELLEEVKFACKQLGSLMKSMDSRGYSLNNITKLRIAQMEEVEV